MSQRAELAASRPDVRLSETWDRIWNVEPEYHDDFGFDLDLWGTLDAELARLPGPLLVLDVAGGRGEFLWWLRSSGRTDVLWSTLVDFSPRAIEEARRARRADEYHVLDAASEELLDTGEHDVVVGIDFLEVVDDPLAVVRNLAGVVTPRSGRLFLAVGREEHWQQRRSFDVASVASLMREAGLDVVGSQNVGTHAYCVGKRRP